MEAVALADAQDIVIHGGPLSIALQAFAYSPQASDLLVVRRHCLDCIVELGLHHLQTEGSEDCWRQFNKAPGHHEE